MLIVSRSYPKTSPPVKGKRQVGGWWARRWGGAGEGVSAKYLMSNAGCRVPDMWVELDGLEKTNEKERKKVEEKGKLSEL